MRAITLSHFGGPEVLTVSTCPEPVPAATELLVKVKACGVNRADLLQRRGKYSAPAGVTDILGLEIAGMVTATGAETTGFAVGDNVFGLVPGGAYAEYCVIDQGCAMLIPEKFSFIEAAAIPEAFLTAVEAVHTLGKLYRGESILIHAGGSGVGTAAIQLARLTTDIIFATTGSETKFDKIKNLGAQYVFNYKEQDFAAEILALTENKGVDVIIDFVGAKYLKQHLDILQPDGRLSLVGLMGGHTTEMDLSPVHKKRLQIKGLTMRTQPLSNKQAMTTAFETRRLPLFAEDRLMPVIDSVFPFTEVRAAHEYMEKNLNVGKIILNWDY